VITLLVARIFVNGYVSKLHLVSSFLIIFTVILTLFLNNVGRKLIDYLLDTVPQEALEGLNLLVD
jgi:hypothetical protein